MEAQQRAEIINYARKVIVQMGVKALRMDDIAQATHTSKRTLYETFGDKEELLFLAARAHFDAFDQNNIEAAKDADNILIAMLIIMEEIRKNDETNWQILSTLKKFYPKVNQRLWHDKADLKRKIVADSIKTGIEEGYIDSRINIPLTMNMFSYIAIGITQHNDMIEIPKEINTEDAFQEVLVNYIRGISTIKGVQAIDEHLSRRKNNNEYN
ncbi:MAG: TetR/AcrR family transcriptional regulator [Rikenellaceae bacterium]